MKKILIFLILLVPFILQAQNYNIHFVKMPNNHAVMMHGKDSVNNWVTYSNRMNIEDIIGYLSVKDYGALGDGTTDDRAHIQACITAAGSNSIIYIPDGDYLIKNAFGSGADTIAKRADAVANNTLYSLKVTGDNVTIIIKGNLIAFSLLDDLFKITGDNCKVIGYGGIITGCGHFLDTNKWGDPTLQWFPSLIRFESCNYGEVSGLIIVDPPTVGILGWGAIGLNVHDNIIRGGPSSHGTGTVNFGVSLDDASSYCSVTNNLVEPSVTSGKVYVGFFGNASHILVANNRVIDAISHAVYFYGDNINISDNVFSASDMLYASIQTFADNLTITGNAISDGTTGIDIRKCRNSIISNNTISNIRVSGILYSSLLDPLDADTVSNITIANNFISFDDTSTVMQGGIDIRAAYNLNNVNITNNTITGSGNGWDYAGIVLATAASYMVSNSNVSGNIIKNTEGYGMILYRVRYSKISGNLIINADTGGASQKNSIYSYILRNSVINDNYCYTATQSNIDYHISLGTGSNNNYLINNILLNFTQGPIDNNGTGNIFYSINAGAFQLTPLVSPPSGTSEGAIYMDTDHHLYINNGSSWIQLDN
jgi:parallel beta-helix repeat protein